MFKQPNISKIPNVNKKILAVYVLLLIAAFVQITPRLGENSPKSIAAGQSDVREFYGYRVSGGDTKHHLYTSALFKGGETSQYGKKTVMNRRGLNGYLYSITSLYFHPYIAAVTINAVFYFLILVAGFCLARHFRLSRYLAFSFSILLSANYFLLHATVKPYFYLQYSAFIFFIYLLAYKLQIFSNPLNLKRQFYFLAVLCCGSLTYDPFVFISFYGLLYLVFFF